MAKKSDKKTGKKAAVKTEPTDKCVCQYCANHRNHPSKCKKTGKYVGRKAPGCKEFK